MITERSLVDPFAPIGLEALDATSALQTRVERKYLVALPVLEALLERLLPTHRALQIDGLREFGYRTTYYDTPDLRSLREHRQRRRRRYKFRRRHYLETDRAALEVKLRGTLGRTVKHALPSGLGPGLTDAERAFMAERVLEAYGRTVPSASLVPVLGVHARRITLVAPELGERFTCDVAVDLGGRSLRSGYAIVESKSRRGSAVADRVLRRLGERPVACSKYCLGIGFARPDVGTGDYRRLRTYFVEGG